MLRLKEEQRESLTLLPSASSEKAKTEADLLQDKQRLALQLQQAQKHLEVRLKDGLVEILCVHKSVRRTSGFQYDLIYPCQVLQKKMKELKAQTDLSNQNHAAKLDELSSFVKEKEDLIQNLQMKLKESEVGFKWKQAGLSFTKH